MLELLPDRIPWYVAGPVMGLCVVALYALVNQRLGVSGSYHEVGMLVRGKVVTEMWRIWFFAGLAVGAFTVPLLRGGFDVGLGYGALGLVLPLAVLIPVLFLGGVLMGYGARWAGGCTSGHGIGGTSSLSPASFVAVITFMAAAIGVTYLIHLVTGGAL